MGVTVPIVVEGRPAMTVTTTAIIKRPPLVSVGRRQSSRRLLLDGASTGPLSGSARRGSVGGVGARPRCSVSGASVVVAGVQKGGDRRGSIGKKAVVEASLARKGSGTGLKPLSKKASRSNLRTVQIKIQLEGYEKDDNKNKDDGGDHDDEKENRPSVVIHATSSEQKKPLKDAAKAAPQTVAADKKRTAAVMVRDSDKEDASSATRIEVGAKGANRGQLKVATAHLDLGQVDRGLVNLRGRGEAGLEIAGQNSKRPRQGIPREKSATLYDAEVFSKFAKDALNSHNKYRARHGVHSLELDPALCVHAQKYAEKLAKSCTFQHSGDPLYGENLYWGWSSDPNFYLKGWEPVDSWYEESLANYNYNTEPPDSSSGHFTQVVWAASRLLGVGLAKSPTGRHIVVMKYDPPGNFVGQYCQNVTRPVI